MCNSCRKCEQYYPMALSLPYDIGNKKKGCIHCFVYIVFSFVLFVLLKLKGIPDSWNIKLVTIEIAFQTCF